MCKAPYTVEHWFIVRGGEAVLAIPNISKSKAKRVCELINEADRRAREEERAKIGKDEPEISCAEGYKAWPVTPVNERLCYAKRLLLDEIASDARWTGRYGYMGDDGQVVWRTTPRAWKDKQNGHILSTPDGAVINEYTPVLPDYVEMRK